MTLPQASRFVVIGAGVHGLSAAWQLALLLKAQGRGSGRDIVVLDKSGVGAGASGIACGVVRNNYFQPAMRELMAHSVAIWEEDATGYSYHPVGYMQISPEVMHADVATIYQQQRAIGYDSEFIEGEADCTRYLRGFFNDWQAKGITSVLHEKRGGYANAAAAMRALAAKAETEGVSIRTGVRVTGFEFGHNSDAVAAVETDQGTIACEQVIVAPGPWVRDFWSMLELPEMISVKEPDGTVRDDVPMWRFWQLEEGVLGVSPNTFMTNDGTMPPVMHVDTDAPLLDADGALVTDQLWGIYYKPDFHFGGVQGGASPYKVDEPAGEVAIDPYGPASPKFIASKDFERMWCAALAFCHKRFEGKAGLYKHEPSGGIGAFTPDSFPVFDRFRENVYVIADSNHGFKMIGVGKLVAEELTNGNGRSALLEPFRFSRYAESKLHPVSRSPFPWS
jgi:glycine/D-amino acid oxidase-like deaminating enzyme